MKRITNIEEIKNNLKKAEYIDIESFKKDVETISNYKKRLTFKNSRLVFWFKLFGLWMKNDKNALYNNGIHYIDGSTGVGKTLVMNIVLNRLLKKTGFMFSSIDEFYNPNVKLIDVSKIWNNGKTNYRLPYYYETMGYCKGMIFDEINQIFNRRMNKLTAYNDIFIPLINWCVKHRHKKIPRLYFIGQDLELQDTQLQKIIRYQHVVESKKRYYYYYYRNELIMVQAPKVIKITHYIKNKNGNGFAKFSKTKIKVRIQDLISYNTYGFSNDNDDLPILFSK